MKKVKTLVSLIFFFLLIDCQNIKEISEEEISNMLHSSEDKPIVFYLYKGKQNLIQSKNKKKKKKI